MVPEPRTEEGGHAPEEGGSGEGDSHFPSVDFEEKREAAPAEDSVHLGLSVEGQRYLGHPGIRNSNQSLLQHR